MAIAQDLKQQWYLGYYRGIQFICLREIFLTCDHITRCRCRSRSHYKMYALPLWSRNPQVLSVVLGVVLVFFFCRHVACRVGRRFASAAPKHEGGGADRQRRCFYRRCVAAPSREQWPQEAPRGHTAYWSVWSQSYRVYTYTYRNVASLGGVLEVLLSLHMRSLYRYRSQCHDCQRSDIVCDHNGAWRKRRRSAASLGALARGPTSWRSTLTSPRWSRRGPPYNICIYTKRASRRDHTKRICITTMNLTTRTLLARVISNVITTCFLRNVAGSWFEGARLGDAEWAKRAARRQGLHRRGEKSGPRSRGAVVLQRYPLHLARLQGGQARHQSAGLRFE